MATARGELVNKSRFCSFMGWTRQTFDRHVREGMPVAESPTDKGGEYKVQSGEAAAWLLAQAAGAAEGGGPIDLNAERARLTKEQADQTAMKNQAMRAELLPADKVSLAVTSAFARVRTRLLAIPPKAAPRMVGKDRPAEIQAALSDYVEEALRELSETEVLGESVEGADP